MDETIEQHIKLTLKPEWHSDVIAIINRIEPGKLAATVIEALRVWQRGGAATGAGVKTRPEASVAMEAAAPIMTAPAAVVPLQQQPNRSKVSLSVGFDALDE